MNADLREALEVMSRFHADGEALKALQTLVNLAESYLSIKGMPEEYHVMEDLIDENNVLSNREVVRRTHNHTLSLCKLALLAKCENLEKVIGEAKIGRELMLKDFYMPDKSIKDITATIKSHLLGVGK